jgi:Uma2 family endonuclease
VTYLDGILEIVAPSLRHEDVKSRLGDLLLIYFLETDTEYYPKGSTTFRQQERRGGTEADESYCIGTDKAIPDLAIEVVITSGGLNRLEVYHRLGIPEVYLLIDVAPPILAPFLGTLSRLCHLGALFR